MKRLLLTISFICLFLVGHTIVNGAEWVQYSEGTLDDKYFYDKANVTSDGKGAVTVWSKKIFSEKGKQAFMKQIEDSDYQKYKGISYELNLVVIKCSSRQYYITFMSQINTLGKEIDQYSPPTHDYRLIPPGSSSEALYSSVCKRKK